MGRTLAGRSALAGRSIFRTMKSGIALRGTDSELKLTL
jgi:hypothetical protein